MLVSVVVPAYNAQGTIRQCLVSLVEQSFSPDNFEILMVDDGSTDRTEQIIKEFSLRYIRQTNQGPAAARNRGARQAKGEIILFTDADCIADSDWIKEMVRPFANPEVIGVKGAYKNREGQLIARLAQLEFEERYRLLEKSRERIDMVDTYSGGFRRDIFLKMGGFDISFPVANNEDTELSYRLSRQNYKMVFNRKAIVYHLGHPKTFIQYLRLKFGRGYWRMVVYKRFPKKMGKDSYTPQIMKLQVLLFYLLVLSGFSITIVPEAGYLLLFAAVGFLISTIPFFLLSLKEGRLLGLTSPLFLTGRAASLGAGAIIGLFHRQRKL